jgi:methionyl aminopeptidase
MSIRSTEDFDGMTEIGRVVRAALDEMEHRARPGMSTRLLDRIGGDVLQKSGAVSAPMKYYDFPADICISVNDAVVHGIPSDDVIEEGDLVKIDVTAEKDGYIADSARTIVVGDASPVRRALARCASEAFDRAMAATRAGNRVNAIGRAIEDEVALRGFVVVDGLGGHGVGRAIHEDPVVPNVYTWSARRKLTEGLVLAVEPMVACGASAVYEDDDGWTIRSADGSMTAHHEHTVVVTGGEPIVLT